MEKQLDYLKRKMEEAEIYWKATKETFQEAQDKYIEARKNYELSQDQNNVLQSVD